MQIAIDGPVGSGKSSVSREVAKRLGFVYLDTGAMYRAVALYCLESFMDLKEPAVILKALDEIDLSFQMEAGSNRILLNGIDVTDEIRMQHIGEAASTYVATVQPARDRLVQLQQQLAKGKSVVMDGRDIGRVVLPQAQLKVFLTAAADTRAQRRYQELLGKGESPELDTIIRELVDRDQRDMFGPTAPLRLTEDAITVDTTHMDIEEAISAIVDLAKERGAHA